MHGFVELAARRLFFLRNVELRHKESRCSQGCCTPPQSWDQAEVRS